MGFIGVIDSGVGGLTVLQRLRQNYSYDFVYVADHAYCPYGTKPNDVVFSRASALVGYLKNDGAQAVVLACNTMSVYAKQLQQLYDVPVYDVITPTCKRIAESGAKSVALLATRSTIANGLYQENLSRRGIDVVPFDCSAFVPFVEQRTATSLACQQTVNNALHALPEARVDAVILGCTHFPLLRRQIACYCANADIFECSCDLPCCSVCVSAPRKDVVYLTTGNVDFADFAADGIRGSDAHFKHITLH